MVLANCIQEFTVQLEHCNKREVFPGVLDSYLHVVFHNSLAIIGILVGVVSLVIGGLLEPFLMAEAFFFQRKLASLDLLVQVIDQLRAVRDFRAGEENGMRTFHVGINRDGVGLLLPLGGEDYVLADAAVFIAVCIAGLI